MTESAPLDVLFMPEDLRKDLCVDLLESVGASKINVRDGRGEIIHCCPLPWHHETRPSASLNWEKMTFKCLGCNSSGGILWFIGVTQGISGPEAREWIGQQTGTGGKEFALAPLLQFLDAVEESLRTKPDAKQQMPRFGPQAIEAWTDHICPWLTTGVEDLGIEGRGIPEQNIIDARVGWDLDANAVVIPHFWQGDLVGWQARNLNPNAPEKYKSTPDFPRDRTIYNYDRTRRTALVVESPMSVLRHMHHLPIQGTFGAAITERQIQLLKWHDEVCFWVDNDEAGWRVMDGRIDSEGRHHPGPAEQLTAYTNVTFVPSDWHADPADLDDAEAQRLFDARLPYFLWKRPEGLRCLECRQVHSGHCA